MLKAPRSSSPWLPALLVGVFMAALDTAVLGPALPALRESFGLDHGASGLLMSVYVLFSLCSAVWMAALGDSRGRRRVFLICLGLFALGSAWVAASQSLAALLLGRAIQGVGGGGLVPTATAVIGDRLAPEARARALGLLGATYGMAFVLGPPLASLLMLGLSWRWVFLLNLPVALVAFVFAHRRWGTEGTTAPARSGFDRLGLALLFITLAALTTGIHAIGDAAGGMVSAAWWCLAAVVSALAWLVRESGLEQRGGSPVVPISLLRHRPLAVAYAASFGSGAAMGGIMFMALQASLQHGLAPKAAGFALIPMVVASMVGSMAAGRVQARFGARPLVVMGFGLLSAGYLGVAGGVAGWFGFMLSSVPLGLGIGVVVGGALRSVALDEAPSRYRGVAQGLVNVFTGLGTMVSSAAIGAMAEICGGGATGLSCALTTAGLFFVAMAMVASRLPRSSAHAQADHGTA